MVNATNRAAGSIGEQDFGMHVSELRSGKGPAWRPQWFVDVGDHCRLGITVDDGCFIVLYPHPNGVWRPGTHVPQAVAERMAELRDQVA